MRVLVTGASGFVGRAVVRHLAAAGHAVLAATRSPLGEAASPLVAHRPLPNLARPFDATALVADVDAVVHAAGLAHRPRGTTDTDLHRVNAEATARLAEAAARQGLSRFVLISSIRAIAGPSAEGILDETATPAPSDAYGRSKLAGEQAARAALPATIVLRPPVIHGAGAKGNMIRLARLARLPFPLPLAGLEGRRSILSDRNLASAVAFALETSENAGRTFHLDDGMPVTVPDMIGMMRAALGRPANLVGGPVRPALAVLSPILPGLRDQLDRDLVVSSAAIRAKGWTPAETSAAGLARLARGAEAAP